MSRERCREQSTRCCRLQVARCRPSKAVDASGYESKRKSVGGAEVGQSAAEFARVDVFCIMHEAHRAPWQRFLVNTAIINILSDVSPIRRVYSIEPMKVS